MKIRKPIIPKNSPLKAVHLTAPDGIVLTGNVPESVVIKAQQKLRDQQQTDEDAERGECSGSPECKIQCHHRQPTVSLPRLSASSARTSSARKFRSMVMSSRSVTSE